ncbi:hypothetical protein Tco_1115956 [Tanacetum coccineum]
MGEPLSPDRVFDFPMDEPHPAYDFFTLASLPGYAGNPNNNNGWLVADGYLLGELKAMVDEQMVVPAVEEVAEPVEELQVIAPVVDVVEGQIDAPMMDMEEDLAVLFGDDDFEDDASDGFGEEEVWEVNEDWLMAPTTPPPVLAVPPPSVYEVGGPSTAVAEGPSFPQVASGLPVPSSVIEENEYTRTRSPRNRATEDVNRIPTLRRDLLGVARYPRWVEAKQLMAVKKTYFPEMEGSGSIVANVPGIVED